MTSHDNVTDIELFADDVTGVQSRIVICHQLLASADIQDKQTKAETGWADTSDRAELMRKAASTITTLRKQLENAREALRHIKIEAEREQGHWQHLKRVIAVHAAEALKGQPDNKPSGIPVDSPTSIQHDKSGYTP